MQLFLIYILHNQFRVLSYIPDKQEACSMFNLEEELKKLPAKPGVYIMHDKWDNIIYIGKAKILKNRVRQYFQSSRNKSAKIVQMVSHIQYFEYIITDSELEALVLECNLIKEHRPKYNTMLKDDKSFLLLRLPIYIILSHLSCII